MRESFYLLFKLGELASNEVGICEFLSLIAQEIFVGTVGCYLLFKFFECCLGVAIFAICGAILLQLFAVVGYDVDNTQLEVVFLKQEILMLAMDIDELFAKLASCGERDGSVVDKGTTLAVGA